MTNDNHTEYLEMEIERYREEERQRQEGWERRWNEREREARERYEESLRTADNWLDALRNQSTLFGREVKEESGDPDDRYFTEGLAACQRAIELWPQVKTTKQDHINRLKEQIEHLKAELEDVQNVIAAEIGQQLLNDPRAKRGSGWNSIADTLVNGVDSFDNWLYW